MSIRPNIILQGAGPGAAQSADVPGVAALLPSYPNPFNPQTTVRFRLERPARVRLAVYDVLGREVAVLREGWLPMGTHEHVWNAAGRASGLYLIRLDAGGATLSRTALLVR
ncbi:MAG: T9SS type A sorting domain-containing protein [Bacteroidetes bacterium]|nr:T9SS type A sorting domain-containing protein [Bacteroidota bacterium]